jgi:cytoskeletal protein CcmA (bactofilin family)
MLFNKKPDDEPAHDPAANVRAGVSPQMTNHAQPSPRKGPTRSLIDPGLIITGTLEGEGELHIEGQVRGDIFCKHLTIGSAATVDGNVAAEEVVVRGKVTGVIGGNRVLLMDSAHVESNIFHKRLAMEEGACFEGEARYTEEPIEKARSKASQVRGEAAAAAQVRHEEHPVEAASWFPEGDKAPRGATARREEQPLDKANGKPVEMTSGANATAAHMEADLRDLVVPSTPSEPVKSPPPRTPRARAKMAEQGTAENAAAAEQAIPDASLAAPAAAAHDRLRARLRS